MLARPASRPACSARIASSIAGEIPPDQALPEVWVEDDSQLDAARALLGQLRHPPQRHWVCRHCHERIDGPFEQCWNCGAAMPRYDRDARTALLMTMPPLMWAGNAVVGRLLVGHVPPLTLNLMRWVLAALLLLPLGWRALRRPRDIRPLALPAGHRLPGRWHLQRVAVRGADHLDADST